jgi:hypothetical protein
MRLAERSATSSQDGKLVIDGTMGPPTHWDYAVNMNETDVLDFVKLLEQPASVRFVTEADAPGLLVRTALVSGVVFVWNTIRCFLGMAPPSQSAAAEKPAVGKKAA